MDWVKKLPLPLLRIYNGPLSLQELLSETTKHCIWYPTMTYFLLLVWARNCFLQNWLHSSVPDVQHCPRKPKPNRSSSAFWCGLPHHPRSLFSVIGYSQEICISEEKVQNSTIEPIPLRFSDKHSHDCRAKAGAKEPVFPIGVCWIRWRVRRRKPWQLPSWFSP